MNAHQRRKASRAKDREPWVMFVPADLNEVWMKALLGDGTQTLPADVPLIRGEIGTIER